MKMNVFKKTILGLGIASLIFSSGTLANANSQLQVMKNEISMKSNSEFDEFLVNYVRNAKKNNKDSETIQSELNNLGIEFSDSSPTADSQIGILSNLPSDVAVTVYAARRGGESFYRIIGNVEIINTMTGDQGSLDLLSLEWDPSVATYYSYAAENNTGYNFTSLMDYSQRSQGGMVFNVEDTRMKAGHYTYGAVYVTPKANTSGKDLEYGVKYIHTYDDKGVTWKVGVNVGYQKGYTGGVTLELLPTSTSKTFTKSALNAITF